VPGCHWPYAACFCPHMRHAKWFVDFPCAVLTDVEEARPAPDAEQVQLSQGRGSEFGAPTVLMRGH